jgi:hypothetical protein
MPYVWLLVMGESPVSLRQVINRWTESLTNTGTGTTQVDGSISR